MRHHQLATRFLTGIPQENRLKPCQNWFDNDPCATQTELLYWRPVKANWSDWLCM